MTSLKENHFIDWFINIFGYGYGTGERPVLEALMVLLNNCGDENADYHAYDYKVLESEIGSMATWLLINTLCNDDIIEYGTSPRFAWLTRRGLLLKKFVKKHTIEELEGMLSYSWDEHIPCYPDACNCGANGYEEGKKCDNPLFK